MFRNYCIDSIPLRIYFAHCTVGNGSEITVIIVFKWAVYFTSLHLFHRLPVKSKVDSSWNKLEIL